MQQLTCKPDIKSSPPTLRSSPAHACEPTHPTHRLQRFLLQQQHTPAPSIQTATATTTITPTAALSLWPCSRPPYTSSHCRADVTTRRRHSSTKPFCPSATHQHLPARHTRHPATPSPLHKHLQHAFSPGALAAPHRGACAAYHRHPQR